MATVFKRGGKKAKGYWYVQWYDHNGKRRSKCTQTTDKATAERIARKHEADAALRRDGVIDPTLDAISNRDALDRHPLLPAIQAELWREAGDTQRAIERYRAALGLARSAPEHRWLSGRLAALV